MQIGCASIIFCHQYTEDGTEIQWDAGLGIPIANTLVRYYAVLLLFAGGVACVGFPLARQLNLDWRIEGMFPAGDPLVESYRQLQQRFGGNDLCLAVYRDPGLWDESGDGLERLEQVSRRLSRVDGVQAVLSLAELHRILETMRSPLKVWGGGESSPPPLLNPQDELAQSLASVFEGYTHRQGSPYVAIACLLKSSRADEARERGPSKHEATLEELRRVLAALPAPATDGLVTGEPVLVAEGFKMVERDGWRLGIVSSVLVSIVLFVCFRSLRWTLIPLLVVHWSVLTTQALLVVLQLDLTMISSTLTANVTVIGVATSMHLILKFQEQRRTGALRAEALRAALAALIVPIFWACVTDAVGFSALMIAGVGPVRDFGLMMAIASMVVFVAIVVLVPGLALVGRWDADPRTPKLDWMIRLWLRKLLEACLAHRSVGLGTLVLLLILGAIGSAQLQVETDFTKNFGQDSVVVQGYSVIERELEGAGVWDIMLPAPASIDGDYLQQVLDLEAELRSLVVNTDGGPLSLTKVLSVADAVQATESASWLAALPAAARLEGMRASMPEFTGALLTQDADAAGFRWLRIMLRSREQASAAAKGELVDMVRQTVDDFTQQKAWTELFEAPSPNGQIAGYHVMLGKLVSNVLVDQWRCFFLATLGIYLVMTLALRSPRLGLAALVPNALPILLVLGTMGWLGVRANMGAAMIAAVSLGLSVDSSIHYLFHYQRRLYAGARPQKALRSAQENVGLAVVIATIALIAGFISLCTSEFVPTVVFGTLASLTMLGGLLGNLVVLPLVMARQ